MTQNIFSLEGQVAVVLGGASGIGKALSLGLAAAALTSCPAARREAEFRRRPPKCARSGAVRSRSPPTSPAARRSMRCATSCSASSAKSNILINCAGRIQRIPTPRNHRRAVERHLGTQRHGVLRACQAFGPGMLSRGYGRIATSPRSTASSRFHEVTAYAASKAAVARLPAHSPSNGARAASPSTPSRRASPHRLQPKSCSHGTERGRELLMRTPMKRSANSQSWSAPPSSSPRPPHRSSTGKSWQSTAIFGQRRDQ